MKIATVTLNPAIDQTVSVNDFQVNTVNRGQGMRFDAGGKGVNVASYLADYGLNVAATGFLGEENTLIFEQLFAAKGIEDYFVRIPGSTRTGVKIVDEANQQTTDINMPGQSPSPEAIHLLFESIERLSATCEWFVLSGNLPPDTPEDIYSSLIELLKSNHKQVILDTSREALIQGIQAAPDIVKPNIDELEQLVGHPISGAAAIEQAARQLLDGGIELVVVSMGAEGAIFVNGKTSLIARPPSVTVKSTVGAGDAMVAGILSARIRGLSLPESARLATAFSVGAITRVGAHLPEAELLESYARQVEIDEIERIPLTSGAATQ
jgi:1-phosphofructokinase